MVVCSVGCSQRWAWLGITVSSHSKCCPADQTRPDYQYDQDDQDDQDYQDDQNYQDDQDD